MNRQIAKDLCAAVHTFAKKTELNQPNTVHLKIKKNIGIKCKIINLLDE